MMLDPAEPAPRVDEFSDWIRELLRLGLYSEAILIIDSLDQNQLQQRYSLWRSRRIQRDCDEVCSLPPRFADLRIADAGAAAEAAAGALQFHAASGGKSGASSI